MKAPDKLSLAVSALMNRIYVLADGKAIEDEDGNKFNVTESAISAVAIHFVRLNKGMNFEYEGKNYHLSVKEIK